MPEYNIDQLNERNLRRKPLTSRRLRDASTELSLPLEHIESEMLPLDMHETLGVGYAFDRLMFINLNDDIPVARPLPGRHELTKFAAGCNANHMISHRGSRFHFGGQTDGSVAKLSSQGDYSGLRSVEHGDFAGITAGVTDNLNTKTGIEVELGDSRMTERFVKAFIGSGKENDTTIGISVKGSDTKDMLNINYDMLCNLGAAPADLLSTGVIGTLQYLYQRHSPSAWNTVVADLDIYKELPKLLPYLDKALFSLYERDKMGAFKTRVRNIPALYTMLSQIELMFTVKRGRFSHNVGNSGAAIHLTDGTNDLGAFTNGVINKYFTYIDAGTNGRIIICPWWLVNKLNIELFKDTTRDEEISNVERSDLINFNNLLFEAMEEERGLALSSESNIPMMLFEQYSEGKLPSFGDRKDPKAAVSAALLGFTNALDVHNKKQYRNKDGDIVKPYGALPYYPRIISDNGTIIGKELREFKDRIAEAGDSVFITASSESLKHGMQMANGVDYTTMSNRTRFGDHSTRVKIHMFGFFRLVPTVDDDKYLMINSLGTSVKKGRTVSNVLWFPIYGWSQFYEGAGSKGSLPNGMNGGYYIKRTSEGALPIETGVLTTSDADLGDAKLWWSTYWRPGADNHCLLLMQSTDDMFRAWMDRGDQVRQEGAVFPTLSTMNIITEMTYSTPFALLQRNLPYLRQMSTITSLAVEVDIGDNSIDFMTLGDNIFSLSPLHSEHSITGGPLSLRDRQLFNANAHAYGGELELARMVIPLAKMPENWVAIFQARDWLYANTSLLSEPIMDTYSFPASNSGLGSTGVPGKRHAFANARLVVYQGPKTFEGVVEDVYCTPLIGVGLTYEKGASPVQSTASTTPDYSLVPVANVFPEASEITNNMDVYNYQCFRLGSESMTDGQAIIGRYGRGSGDNLLFLLDARTTDGDARYGRNLRSMSAVAGTQPAATTVTEDDFTPGLYWDKLPWVGSEPVDTQGRVLPYTYWFRQARVAGNPGDADSVGINYLQGVSVPGLPSTGFPGFQMTSKDDWNELHIRFVEQMRTNLEFQRANLNFTVLDLDITDETESYLRQSLVNLGLTTTGPLTYVGTIGPEGQQVDATILAGETVFEIVSLTMGTGVLDESPSQADDNYVGEDNPSMHIVDAKDV